MYVYIHVELCVCVCVCECVCVHVVLTIPQLTRWEGNGSKQVAGSGAHVQASRVPAVCGAGMRSIKEHLHHMEKYENVCVYICVYVCVMSRKLQPGHGLLICVRGDA